MAEKSEKCPVTSDHKGGPVGTSPTLVPEEGGERALHISSAARALTDEELSELLNLSPGGGSSKPERDFVLAAFLMRTNAVSGRTLRSVLKRWTPFGRRPLRDFLLEQKVCREEVLAQAEQESLRFFSAETQRGAGDRNGSTVARRTSTLLDRIDPTGGVAKVLGLSLIPKEVVGDEVRTFKTQFRLLRKLGQGGLGTVWLAIDTSLNRYVALKEIASPGGTHSVVTARFRREAEITGRLDHPSIVPLHVLGENEADGRLFYVMRFLGNQTLDDAIREYHDRREGGTDNPLDFHRLLVAFVSVCQAIAYAHSHKVIHRDLKPQNIALDRFGQVVVLDWGLAKVLGMEDPERYLTTSSQPVQGLDSLDVTLAGQVMGTPMYMSPEQASGRVDEIDELTDVYGLGAILFAILTGYAPHELSHQSLPGDNRIAALLDSIADPQTTPPRKLNPQVSPSLEAICLKAMSRDRRQRYPSVSVLSDDLQRWMADQPISAAQEPTSKRLHRWIGRHSRLSIVIAFFALLLAVLITLGSIDAYQRGLKENQARLQVLAKDTQELEARLTHEIDALRDNVRFMSTVPLVQDLLQARQQKDAKAEAQWTQRLTRIYRGLIEANASYMAVTYWIEEPGAKGPPVRAENPLAQPAPLQSDLRELFGRHLPAISGLARRDVYVGMPGRMTPIEPVPSAAPAAADAAPAPPKEPVGRCLVAGIGVYDENRRNEVGGVMIECDLEEILREHLPAASNQRVVIWLTDETGRPQMQFTPERGLWPLADGDPAFPGAAEVRTFLTSTKSEIMQVISPTLSVARIPLSLHDPDHFMGVVTQVRTP